MYLQAFTVEPGTLRPIQDLDTCDPTAVHRFIEEGIDTYAVCDALSPLVQRSLRASLDRARCSIDMVLYCTNTMLEEETASVIDGSLSRNLGLDHAPFLVLGNYGCANFFAALRFARALMLTEDVGNIAIVCADRFTGDRRHRVDPSGMNLENDGVASCILSREPLCDFAVAVLGLGMDTRTQITDNPRQKVSDLIQGTSRAVGRAVEQTGLPHRAIQAFMGPRTRREMCSFYAQSCRMDRAAIWASDRTIRIAHNFSADTIINLREAEIAGWSCDAFVAFQVGMGHYGAAVLATA